MFETFEDGRERVAGIEIAYSIGGSGPPVLMLHGFPQNRSMWAHVASRLADRFTIVCADLRGYGDSAKPEDDGATYSFRAMAADQIGLMRALGFPRFHVVGHDRGGRAGHRMALDHADAVASLAVLDIVPTHAMFADTNRHIAGAYWHWYFLSQPAPFPETMIGADPDTFYETCLVGWGATRLEDLDQALLADYRRCWRDPEMIRGSCADYRAAAGIDLEHDGADIAEKVGCPVLAFWGSNGTIHKLFDVGAQWRRRCARVDTAMLPGGHFFIDTFPTQTAAELERFLAVRSI